jgi:NAD(P)H-hydrate epimerase
LLLQAIAGYDALLIGCGLGVSTATRRLVEAVLYTDRNMPPTVVDADGLNILSLTRSKDMPWWRLFPRPAVLTPHPGEMARLRVDSPTEPGGRIDIARESADRWNKVAVLKGAHTVVASPGGGVMVSPFANPGLATAGTGDVLAGVISGLLAHGLSLAHAASLGVYLHGAAGESVRRGLGDSGIVASDLLPEVPRAAQALRQG